MPPRGGGNYKDGGVADKPSRSEISERRIEEKVSSKVVKHGISILRRFLKSLVTEVEKHMKVRETKDQKVSSDDAGGSDKTEVSEDHEMELTDKDLEKSADRDRPDARNLLQSTPDSTLNLVALLMRSLLKILGPQTVDEDEEELEDGEISQMFSQLTV